MTSRRKQARNSRAVLAFQLRGEGDALKRGSQRRQRRLARQQIRFDDVTLASALSSVSVAESQAQHATTFEKKKDPVPVIGAPIEPHTTATATTTPDGDVSMLTCRNLSVGRVRKVRKKVRDRKKKLHKRLSKRAVMSMSVDPPPPSSTSTSTTSITTSTKSVRFKLDLDLTTSPTTPGPMSTVASAAAAACSTTAVPQLSH